MSSNSSSSVSFLISFLSSICCNFLAPASIPTTAWVHDFATLFTIFLQWREFVSVGYERNTRESVRENVGSHLPSIMFHQSEGIIPLKGVPYSCEEESLPIEAIGLSFRYLLHTQIRRVRSWPSPHTEREVNLQR